MTHSTLRITFSAIALLAASVASKAKAQEPRLATMDGTCHKFIMNGDDVTEFCEGKIVNVAYPDGHSSFMFLLKDKALISFYGTDSRAIGNKASIRVEKITINLLLGIPPTGDAATGVCTYSNPYAGPSLVECEASLNGHVFKVTFVSDGREPSIMGEE